MFWPRALGACRGDEPYNAHLGAQWACPPGLLGLPGPLYCLPGPQYCLSWPSGRQLDAKWTPTWRPRALPGCPQPLRTTLPRTRERKFSKLPFVLSKCSWTAFWQLLGPSWPPFGFNLGHLGRLLGSTWGLRGAFGTHLGPSWVPFGLHFGGPGVQFSYASGFFNDLGCIVEHQKTNRI